MIKTELAYAPKYKKLEVSIDIEKQCYWHGKAGGSQTRVSFDYVEFKAVRLGLWCMSHGVPANVWYEGMRGTIHGLKVMLELVSCVEEACKVRGIKCDALLCPELVDYEGFEVEVKILDKTYKGTIERGDKAIMYHFIRKNGSTAPRILKPYEVKDIKISV